MVTVFNNTTQEFQASMFGKGDRNTFGNFSISPNTVSVQANASLRDCTEGHKRTVAPFEIVAIFVCVAAILVNICVLTVIFNGPRTLRAPTFLFISSLASADLLSSVSVLCAIFVPVSDGAWERIFLKGIAVMCFSASVNSLVVIAYERYVKIRDERAYNRIFTLCNAAALILLSWIFAIAVFLAAPLIGWSCDDGRCFCPTNCMCECDITTCSQSLMPFTKSYVGFGVGYFYFSLSIMIILYAAVFASVKRRACCKRKHGGSIIGSISSRGPFVMIHRRREITLAKTLLIVMCVFFICWLPVTTLFILDVVTNNTSLTKWFDYCLVPAVVHPLINPVIYSMRLPPMWRSFRYLVFAFWRRHFGNKSFCNTEKNLDFVKSSQNQINSKLSRHESGTSSVFSGQSISGTNHRHATEGKRERILTSSVSTQTSNLIQDYSSPICPAEECDSAFLRTGVEHLRSNQFPINRSELSSTQNRWNHVVLDNVGYRDFVVSSKEKKTNNVKTLTQHQKNKKITLASGTTLPRKKIKISQPFNAEEKLAWS